MNRRISWIDALLIEWASWMRDHSRWQGWGAGIDRIEASDGKMPKAPGSYSDRVLSEVIACEANRHGRPSRVHVHILTLPRIERRVLVMRFAGTPQPAQRKVQKVGPYQQQDNHPRPVEFEWSGQTAMAVVAVTLGIELDDAYLHLDAAKLRIMFRMEHDRAIRAGTFMPDGGMSREDYLAFFAQKFANDAA